LKAMNNEENGPRVRRGKQVSILECVIVCRQNFTGKNSLLSILSTVVAMYEAHFTQKSLSNHVAKSEQGNLSPSC